MSYKFVGMSSLNRQVVFGGIDVGTGNPIAKQYDDLLDQAKAAGVLTGNPVRDDNITSSAWGKDIARAIVRANSVVRKVIGCNTEHLEGIDVGETVQLINEEMGVNEEATVKKIKYSWVGSTPEYQCRLTLSSIQEDVIKAISKLKEDIDMLKANASDTSELEEILQFYETFDFEEAVTIVAGAINDGRIWGHTDNGKWGRVKWGDKRTFTTKVEI